MKEWAVWMANKMEEQLLRMEQLRLSEFVAYEKNWKKRLLMQFVGGIYAEAKMGKQIQKRKKADHLTNISYDGGNHFSGDCHRLPSSREDGGRRLL